MTDAAQAAGPAAEAPLQAPAVKPSVQDRLKAFLSASDRPQPAQSGPVDNQRESAGEGSPDDSEQTKEPAKAVAPKVEAQAPAETEGSDGEDTSASDVDFTSVSELADRTGLSLDRLLDLSVPAKIDGKEAKATIRELIKSFQLDGHLTNRLKAAADDRKAFETERARVQAEWQQERMRMDAGVQVLQRSLQSDFADINWQELQKDPVAFNAKYVEFQQRQATLDHLANQIGQERQQQQAQQQQQHAAFIAEQMQLLESKVPEWSGDQGKKARAAFVDEFIELTGKEVGFTREDVERLTDHRDFLVARKALAWDKLQASKPGVLKKVVAAPKLLKPGTSQSQAAQGKVALQSDRDRLRKSGSYKDAANVIKRLGIV